MAARLRHLEPSRELRAMKLLIAPLIGALLFVTAGAAGGVDQLTVSDPSPTPGSSITITSSGWQAGHVVTIGLSGVERSLARVAADASGSVRVRVTIPVDAVLGANVVAATGTTASGIPQRIVAGLTLRRIGPAPAPTRPWVAIWALLAIAAMLLVVSVTVMKPHTRLATG
jgi:hypothetical protein